MRWLWFVGVIAALALASACGGGGEKAAPVLSDADLKGIGMLTPEGLPFPLTLQSDSATSNGEAARAFADPKKWMDNFDSWGRTGGHIATYSSEGGQGTAVQTQVESYKTVGGAQKALSAVRDFMASPEALTSFTRQGYSGAKIEIIDAAKVGDDSVAYRLDVAVDGQPYATLVILFRRGAVLAQASVGAAPDTTGASDAEAVANQMDLSIQGILNSQLTTPQAN